MIRPQPKCLQCDKADVIDQTALDVTTLKESMLELKHGQIELKNAIVGDEFHPDGIRQKVDKHHRRILRIERIIWTCAGGAAVVIFILKVIL